MNTPEQPRILLGIGFMLLAASLFPVMNGLVQWLSPRYPSEQIIWARITGHLVSMLVVMLPASGWLVLATQRPLAQIGRSICQLCSTSFYFVGVASVPLAKAAAISFIAPFIVTLLAWPMLGERPKLRRVLAVCVGFVGVLVVIRPGTSVFQPASLLLLIAACCYALYQVLTRKVAPYDRAETSALYSALLGSVVLSLVVPFFWVTPTSLADGLAFLALGLLGATGHYCVARAMAYAPAAIVAPFLYWQIVGSIIVGFIISGLWPDGGTWIGAAIVVGAGLFLAIAEGRRRTP